MKPKNPLLRFLNYPLVTSRRNEPAKEAVSLPLPVIPPESAPAVSPSPSGASKKFWVIGLALLIVIIAGGALYLLFRRPPPAPPVELTVAFLSRDQFDQPTPEFELMHKVVFERLIDRFNASQTRWRLKFLYLPGQPTSDNPSTLPVRYKQLEEDKKLNKDLIAVFDNGWGIDVTNNQQQLRSFPAPIIFLNADHNGLDLGRDRFFVGNGDPVPLEIVTLLRRLILSSNGTNSAPQLKLVHPEDFIFVTESDYRLTDRFKAEFEAAQLSPSKTVPLDGRKPASRHDIGRAKAQIVAHFLKRKSSPENLPDDDGIEDTNSKEWKEMQARPKLIVLNGHLDWGGTLLPWLDETFRHLTVVCYQSLFARTKDFSFGTVQNENELIALSNSKETQAGSLLPLFNEEIKTFPKAFSRKDSVFFIRRCVLSMELCTTALARIHVPQNNGVAYMHEVSNNIRKFRHEPLESELLGTQRFSSRSGELLNQNIFLMFLGNTAVPDPYQINYSERGGVPKAIAGATVGIGAVDIRNVDIAAGSFHAAFDYWVRGAMEATGEPHLGAPAPRTTDDLPLAEPTNFTSDTEGRKLLYTEPFGRWLQHQYHVSGIFRAPSEDWLYPFDRHSLAIEIRSSLSSDQLRLSQEMLSNTTPINADGWDVRNISTLVTSHEQDPISPLSIYHHRYETMALKCEIRRRLWFPLLLIGFPLILIVVGSFMILKVHFDRGSEATSLSLSFGCVTALITYLIAYDKIAPRLGGPTYSDYLVALLLAVVVFNFIVVVKTRTDRENLRLILNFYSRWGWILVGGTFLCWLSYGLWHRLH